MNWSSAMLGVVLLVAWLVVEIMLQSLETFKARFFGHGIVYGTLAALIWVFKVITRNKR